MSSVLARPGAPTIRLLPPTKQRRQHLRDDLVLADDDLLQLGDDRFAAGIHAVGQRDVVGRREIDLFSYISCHPIH
jgi:hypothetical protein